MGTIEYKIIDEEKPKNKGGRPKGKRYEKPTKKDKMNFSKMELLYSYGMTDIEVCEVFNISENTLNRWKKDKDFYESILRGKALPDQKVARSLYQRAIGYSHEDVDIRVVDKKIVKTKIVKHYPPDVTAASLWLRNRRPDLWRDKQDIEVSGKGGGPVTMKVIYEEKEQPSQKEGK